MNWFKKSIVLVLAVGLAQPISSRAIAVAQTNRASGESLPSFAEPALSPDRSEIAFVSGGDIWTVRSTGGEARLLVSHPANESRPLYSPDGSKLAFISNRTGGGDIYLLSFDTGDIRRLTFDDGNDLLDAWSRDGRWLYFSSSSRDISGMNDVYRVSVEGGTPMQVSADRYASEYFSAPSPDGKTLALTARGNQAGQWWRKGHSHLDECEIWLIRDAATPGYEQLTERGAKNMWPMWSADAANIFFVSDRNGAQNIWSVAAKGSGADNASSQKRGGLPQPQQVTKFKDGRVLWPNISYDGKAIVFERNFAIWRLDTATGQASQVPITRRGAPAGPAVEHLRLTDQIQEVALSPDGKKVAFVVRGEVFAASAKDGGDAARVTNSPSNESQIGWANDSRRLAYVSDRNGTPNVYLYDFSSNTETQLTRDAKGDAAPVFSPDGKMLAFQRDARELRVIDLASKHERVLASGVFGRPPIIATRAFAWSPDSKWLAFTSAGNKSFTNVLVVPAAGGDAKPISFLANVFNNTISWSPDGTFLLFDTAQRTEGGQIARVDLIPRTPLFREDQFRDLFKEESLRPARTTPPPQENRPSQSEQTSAPAAPGANERNQPPKPVEIVFEDIKKRLSLLPVGVDAGYQEISPDGKWLLMIASAAGQQNLYIYSMDQLAREPAVARQLTSTPGFKRDAQFSPDSKGVFYLEQGRINVVAVDTRVSRPVAVAAEMDVDFARQKIEVFNQAWSYLRDSFYDPNFHGVDWQAVRAEYAPHIAGARTPDEMRRVLSLMVGELNASHLGVSPPFSANQASTGKLGLRFDRSEYETSSRLRVSEVIPLGPGALAGIKPGDYLLAIDGTQIGAHVNIDELLSFKTGRRVSLSVSASRDGANKREVAVRPVNTGTEKGLLYRKWVEERRDFVAKISGGRLGYVHMFDMGSGSLAQLFIDLDTENHSREGVVVDVRNNNGGFVNAYAIDVFARRGYMTMTRRGFPAAPARTMLGQRSLEAPTILVTNQHSLSDAEDFTEGYRALKLGKVVGEPTSGWIIYTSNTTLLDGTSIRLPFIRITSSDGKLMELAPRPVDLPVVRPIGESFTERDIQLEVAVRELLKQLGSNSQ